MQRLNKILKDNKYKITFAPLHTNSDIIKYKSKNDAVDGVKYMTILSQSGHVVGRLFHVHDNQTRLTNSDFQQIYDIFAQFEIPKVKNILTRLKELINQVGY